MAHKLLLADDSVTIQRVIELTFADEDVDVTTVGDGQMAIDRLDVDPPDIILADVDMPKRDGYEVAAYVKSRPKLAHIPVVLLTGAFEPIDLARATAAGSSDVLAKPFEPQMVINRVKELLSRKRHDDVREEVPAPPRDAAREPAREPVPQKPQPLIEPPTPAGRQASADAAQPVSLDDYFDQLDAAFSNLQPGTSLNDEAAGSWPASAPQDTGGASAFAPGASADKSADKSADASARQTQEAAVPPPPASQAPAAPPIAAAPAAPPSPAKVAMAPGFAPPAPSGPVAVKPIAAVAPIAPIAPVAPVEPPPAPAAAADQPAMPAAATAAPPTGQADAMPPKPEPVPPAPVVPVAPVAPAAPVVPIAAVTVLAAVAPASPPASAKPATNPFANLSAAKAEAAARPPAPVITEEVIAEIVSRVLQQLSDKVVRETVTEIVSQTAERLVQEEIERIKAGS